MNTDREPVACRECGVVSPSLTRRMYRGFVLSTRECRACQRTWTTRREFTLPSLIAVDPLVITDPGLSNNAVRLYTVLAAYEQPARQYGLWPDQWTLAEEMGKTTREPVTRAVRELRAAGLLTVTPGWGRATGRGRATGYTLRDRARRDRERHQSDGAPRRGDGS